MKKFINDPKNLTRELLEGFAIAHGNLISLKSEKIVCRAIPKPEDKVALVSMSGAGHEPALCGFVGEGMLDYTVAGDIFAAPGPPKVMEALRMAKRREGTMFVVFNHAGDVMNAGMAEEMAKQEGIFVKRFLICDDIAPGAEAPAEERRGLAGAPFPVKADTESPAATPPPASSDGDFTWASETGSAALLKKGQVIWQFDFGTNEAKPSFHPLALPAGPVLTAYRPKDHPWRRALRFSWKYIDGVNYWEEDQTGQSQGRTEWFPPDIEKHPDFSARIVMDLKYRPPDGSTALTEHRVIEVTPPDSRGMYHLDWDLTFQAGGKDVVLDRTHLPSDPDGGMSGGICRAGNTDCA